MPGHPVAILSSHTSGFHYFFVNDLSHKKKYFLPDNEKQMDYSLTQVRPEGKGRDHLLMVTLPLKRLAYL